MKTIKMTIEVDSWETPEDTDSYVDSDDLFSVHSEHPEDVVEATSWTNIRAIQDLLTNK